MATLLDRLGLLITAVGADVKSLQSQITAKPARHVKRPSAISLLTVPGAMPFAQTTLALSADRDYVQPWFVDSAITIDQLSVMVSTAAAASSILRLGLYPMGPDLQAAGNLIEDFGTALVDSTGVKTWTPSGGSRTLQPGRYDLRVNTNGSPTVRTVTGHVAIDSTLASPMLTSNLTVARTNAVFPSTPLSWTSQTISSTGFAFYIFARLTAVA